MKLRDIRALQPASSNLLTRVRGQVLGGWFDYRTAALALVLFAAAMALYARTAAPGQLDGDEGEFQTNIVKLGVSHTGYPTFFLLGKLFTLLVPIGTMATRANLFSAFWGAVAIAAVFLFIRFLTRNTWAALFSALLLVASRVEWSQAVIPRPYTMNSVFVIAVPLLFFLWRIGKVDLVVPVFAFGLSLTNHRTIMWFGPAIAVFVLWADYSSAFADAPPTGSWLAILRQWVTRSTLLKPRRVLSLVAAFILPLFLYGYVWWRGESDVGVEFHWKDFNDEIMGGNVRAWWRFGPLEWLVSRVTDLYVPMLIEQFTAFGFIAGLIGMAALAVDKPPRGWNPHLPAREVLLFIVLANLANSAFCVIFWVIDVDKFFLPSFLTFLFLVGIGIAVIWDWLASRPARRIAQGVVALVLVTATGFLFTRNYPLNDWSRRTDVSRTWDENLSLPLEKNAIIAGPWESITPLEYKMYVDGRRRDLDRWKLLDKKYQLGMVPYGSRLQEIERAVRTLRPVYLTVHPGETETLGPLLNEFRLTRVGELWRVVRLEPIDGLMFAEPAEQKSYLPLQVFADGEGHTLELLDYRIYPVPQFTGDFGLAALFWRMPQSLPDHLSISLRLTDSQNNLVFQRDMEPASGLRPTNGWQANEVVLDDEGFFVPPDAPPDMYRLSIVVYNSATGENYKAGSDLAYQLWDTWIAPKPEPSDIELLSIPQPLDLSIADMRLRGLSLGKENIKGGDTIDLSLWWQFDDPSVLEKDIQISVRDAAGRQTQVFSGPPVAFFIWNEVWAGPWATPAILRGRYSIILPLDLSGRAQLVVQSQSRSIQLPPFDVHPSGRTFTIPSIRHPQTAVLGDDIKLLGYDLDKTAVHPGETVRLTLYWQALKSPAHSYTVFTHALDASGVLRGQKDSVPRGGDLPSDRWLPGEVVADTYDIAIAPDAPAGNYQLEVGMYLSDTGERLPVLDTGGNRVLDDRIIIGSELQVR